MNAQTLVETTHDLMPNVHLVVNRSSKPLRRSLCLVTAAWGLLACDADHPIAGSPRTFVGSYTVRTIDDAGLPTSIVTSFGGQTMSVQQGDLTFSETQFELRIAGPLGGGGNPVTLSTGGDYTVTAVDSLQTGYGVRGRVWKDSAEVLTSVYTLMGSHRIRFIRTPGG
jgi:hypothetical protein